MSEYQTNENLILRGFRYSNLLCICLFVPIIKGFRCISASNIESLLFKLCPKLWGSTSWVDCALKYSLTFFVIAFCAFYILNIWTLNFRWIWILTSGIQVITMYRGIQKMNFCRFGVLESLPIIHQYGFQTSLEIYTK